MFEIGSSLREARIRQDLDFEELETRTKVRAKYLRHLEDERFDQLPGHAYTKGFLRVYADALGLDGRLYVDEYNSRYVAGDEGGSGAPRLPRAPTATRRRRRERRESHTVGVALAAILLVTALVIAAWRFGGPDDPQVEGINASTPQSGDDHAGAGGAAAAGDALDHRGARRVVHGGPGRHRREPAALHGHARARAVPAVHAPLALPLRRPTRQRRREAERTPDRAASRVRAEGHASHRRVRVSRPRAAIVVTGSELVRGERTDRNGPFYAREALGARPRARSGSRSSATTRVDLEATLRAARAADVCLVSGGLGPTHDDRTVELVARVAGVPLRVDEELERHIEGVSRAVAERLRRPYADFAAGVTKQATVPEGAIVIGIAGTAPGLVLDDGDCVFVVLPGPPGELRRLWPAAVASAPVQAVLARDDAARPARAALLRRERVRRRAGAGRGGRRRRRRRGDDLRPRLRDPRRPRGRAGRREPRRRARAALREPLERYLFSEDERTVAEIVLALCRERGLRLATAESCTGGLVAARLTDVPGSSDVFAGGIVAYANDVKTGELGVPEALIAAHGAVSAEVAAAMAAGVRERLGVDVGIAVTGVAGPDGGTEAKPVGLVHLHVSTPDDERGRRVLVPRRSRGDPHPLDGCGAPPRTPRAGLLTRSRHEDV